MALRPYLEAADDKGPLARARQHIEQEHPEMARSDEQIRQRIATEAHDGVAG